MGIVFQGHQVITPIEDHPGAHPPAIYRGAETQQSVAPAAGDVVEEVAPWRNIRKP
jgi:hypothetical protein